MRGWSLSVFALFILACEGREIAVFSANQAGGAGLAGAGASGASGASQTGTAGATSGAFSAGGAGGVGDDIAGSGGSSGLPCQSNQDCGPYPNSFCSKATCKDTRGVCLLRPFPDDTFLPVCGCEDSIIYWNDSWRQRFGIAASTSGTCEPAASCSRKEDCGPSTNYNLSCSHLLPPMVACGAPPARGQCWIIPDACSAADPARELICPGNPGDSPVCATICQAIQSGLPFMPLHHGQACP